MSWRKFKLYTKLGGLGLAGLVILVLLVQNSQKVSINFLFWETRRLPMFLFILSVMGFGVLVYKVRTHLTKLIRQVRQMRRDEAIRLKLKEQLRTDAQAKPEIPSGSGGEKQGRRPTMKGMQVWLVVLLGILIAAGAGCQPWQKKYETCMQEKDNLEGLFASTQQSLQDCTVERDRLAGQMSTLQQELSSARSRPAAATPGAGDLASEGGIYDPRKGTITVPLASDLLFDSGKAVLKSASKTKLNRIAGIIQSKYAGKEIGVVGHTDSDPIRKSSWKDNWELSCERALAVTRYLVEQGIPAKQLSAAGRSEYHPLTANKADNRRVEIVVHMF
ncbi:MAG: DUF1049 domain-containing protein [Sedimentisphaerales bacterium]|nr:DUF1049 domain-containing protein [Sedimentisphaerales bacterium]